MTKHEESKTEDGKWLFSITARLNALDNDPRFRLPEGWQDFDAQQFEFVINDTLAAADINTADLSEGWSTVVSRKRRRTKLPNIPPGLFVD